MQLSFQEWESRSSLSAHFEKSKHSILMLGEKCEAPRRFYSLLIDHSDPFEIGILSSDLGSKPAAFASTEEHVLFIGHDQSIAVLDLAHKIIINQIPLDGVFFAFVADQRNTIVIHELGAVSLNIQGGVRWAVSADIVKRFYLERERLVFHFHDSEKVREIDLKTGNEIDLLTPPI